MRELFDGVAPFVAVAEEGSFQRAGVRLGVSAAAVSKAVSKLEAELGVSLLRRTTRSVALSEEGALFLARCQEAVRQLQAARQDAVAAAQEVSGDLVVSTSPALARLVCPALARLAHAHPALVVHLRFDDQLARFVEDQVHVAVRMGAPSDSALVGRRVAGTAWVLIASPAYLAAFGTPRHADELARHRCVKFFGTRGQPVEWTLPHAARVPTSATLDHGALLVDAALAGAGICQVMRFMVTDELARGALVELLPALSMDGPPAHALCLAGHQHHPRVRAFLDALVIP
jgi:LysR family transcriptional regulator, regulator for bpeEF and oprC